MLKTSLLALAALVVFTFAVPSQSFAMEHGSPCACCKEKCHCEKCKCNDGGCDKCKGCNESKCKKCKEMKSSDKPCPYNNKKKKIDVERD